MREFINAQVCPMVRYSEMYSFLFVLNMQKSARKGKKLYSIRLKNQSYKLMLDTNIFSNMDFINGHEIP